LTFFFEAPGIPEEHEKVKVIAPFSCATAAGNFADAEIRNVIHSTVDDGPCPNFDRNQIGPGWSLVRRTEGKIFSYNDDLAGSVTDGTPHNNPMGAGFSQNFESTVSDYNQFLFATGDCSKWILADRAQIDRFHTETEGEKNIVVDSTHLQQTEHSVIMVGGTGAEGKYPLVTDTSYSEGDIAAEEFSLYHEDNLNPSNNDADTRSGRVVQFKIFH